jgi:hypothetical protein
MEGAAPNSNPRRHVSAQAISLDDSPPPHLDQIPLLALNVPCNAQLG